MSLASILVLLTAILGLYSNPQVSQNAQLKAQVDTLAAQAIQQATVALSQPTSTPLGEAPVSPIVISTPTSTDQSSTQPIVINVTPVQVAPAPIVNEPVLGAVPTSTPSCSLTATVLNDNQDPNNGVDHRFGYFNGANVLLSWTLSDMAPSQGTLVASEIKSGTLISGFPYGFPHGLFPNQTSSTYSYASIYKLSFGGVNCYAYMPSNIIRGESVYPNVGDASTSVEPAEYQQYNSQFMN